MNCLALCTERSLLDRRAMYMMPSANSPNGCRLFSKGRSKSPRISLPHSRPNLPVAIAPSLTRCHSFGYRSKISASVCRGDTLRCIPGDRSCDSRATYEQHRKQQQCRSTDGSDLEYAPLPISQPYGTNDLYCRRRRWPIRSSIRGTSWIRPCLVRHRIQFRQSCSLSFRS